MKDHSPTRRKSRRARVCIEPLEPRAMLAAAILNPSADTFLHPSQTRGDSPVLDVLDRGGGDQTAYVRFDLGAINASRITDATLTFYKVPGTRNDLVVPGRFDTYGLNDQPGNTAQNWDEAVLATSNVGQEYASVSGDALAFDRLFNLNEESGGDVVESVSNSASVNPLSITGSDLVAFLNERLEGGGLATFVSYVDAGNIRGYGYASREHPNPALVPTLELTFDSGESAPARQVEALNRGVVAVRRSTSEVYVGWRLFGDDSPATGFNVYRSTDGGSPVRLNQTPILQTTDYRDDSVVASQENAYFVRSVIDGVEGAASETFILPANAAVSQRLSIPLQIPPNGTTPSGQSYSYNANDASVGDVDGDGEYEYILKWDPSNSGDNLADGYRGNVYIDAYELTGELLWRIDLGQNIRAGAHYTQFMVYDLDGDGRAEIAMRTAPGTIDGLGNPVLLGNDIVTDDYRNSSGVIVTGPEYLTVFDGLTGKNLATVPYEPARGDHRSWGDDYGNRSERHLAAVAYLDGQRPSLVLGRGYYNAINSNFSARNEVAAYDFRDGELTQRWIFESAKGTNHDINSDYINQGAHSMTIGDVDGDGRDEIIYGAAAIDDNGLGLYSTGLGHGDALHLTDMDPNRPGQEVFMVHETPSLHGGVGGEYRDARTGELIHSIAGSGDIGRGVAADIDPNHPGFEMWATTDDRRIYNVDGDPLYDTPSNMFYNFVVWWDADLTRELLDRTTISKWNSPGRSNFDLDPGTSGVQIFAANASSNNGTKATPALSADLFGDWREEVIWRRSDSSHLDIYTTIIPASNRMYTLMHDTQYRVAIAWQNSGYNQPPHPSFFLGAGMADAPVPNIYYANPPTPNLPPTIDAQSFSVTENSTLVGVVLADDPNLPEDVLTYSVIQGNDSGRFSIDPSSGQLSFLEPPDFENPMDVGGTVGDNIYTIEVAVQDSVGSVMPSATMTVVVTDADENPPTLIGITRQDPSSAATHADMLQFRVEFDEQVQSVAPTDFVLTGTTANITRVAPMAGTGEVIYLLDVVGGDLANLNGIVGLDLSGSQDIVDTAGNPLPQSEPALDETYTMDNLAPKPANVIIDDGTGQASLVRSVTVEFDSPIVFQPNAFELKTQAGANVVVSPNVASGTITSQVILTFPNGIGGSLADGNFQLTTIGPLVHDLAGNEFDGDSDGTPGGNATDRFFRLFGDSDGDRDVDGQDYGRFGQTFLLPSSNPAFDALFDFDADGDVDGQDYGQFGLNFLKSLEPGS